VTTKDTPNDHHHHRTRRTYHRTRHGRAGDRGNRARAVTQLELEPPGPILVDQWDSPLDWGDFHQPTRITMIDGAVRGEHFAVIEQAPDARIFLSEAELQRAITALSVALVAMRGFDPGAEEAEAA
jgi:hypothetical protein